MSFLSRMYNSKKAEHAKPESTKNPNRVAGGLRAQGVDRFTLIAEDGSQQELPSIEYVRSLEEQSKKQRAAIDVLERKLARLESSQEKLNSIISRSY
jgi:hypothetical protein